MFYTSRVGGLGSAFFFLLLLFPWYANLMMLSKEVGLGSGDYEGTVPSKEAKA